MNNLIKNELTKIFHKKAIYIVLIIALVFMVLNGLFDKIFVNENYYSDESEAYLREEIKTFDKNNPAERGIYFSLLTELKMIELSKEYEKDSWQKYIIEYNSREIISQMLITEGTEEYQESKKAYDDFVAKLDSGNWRVFAEDELKEVNKQIDEIEKMSEEEKKVAGQGIEDLKDQKQILEWRLQKDIPYGTKGLNVAIEQWQFAKPALRQYESKEKTKELEYEDKYEKQNLEGKIKIYEYAIENGLKSNEQITILNGQTAIASSADDVLVEVFSGSTALFITIAIVIIAGTSVSEEFNKGTIKLLLVKPYKRIKILTAKFISCLIVLAVVYITVAILQFVVGGIFYGFGDYIGREVIYNFHTNSVETISTFKYLLLSGVAILPQYILLMTLAFSLSVIFNNSPIAVALPLLGTMGASIINALALAYEKARFLMYFVTPNWDLSIYLFGRLPQFEPISLPFSIGICLIYFVVMLIVTTIVFNKREVKNV